MKKAIGNDGFFHDLYRDMKRRVPFIIFSGWSLPTTCLLLVWLLLVGCQSPSVTKVIVRVQSGHGKKLYISRVPNDRETNPILDSALVKDMTQDIVFVIPREEERLYQLGFAQSGIKFLFINDAPELSIAGNYLTGRYTIKNSVASVVLRQFLDQQTILAGQTRLLAARIEAQNGKSQPRNSHPSSSSAGYKEYSGSDSLRKALDSLLVMLEKRYWSFADTVKSPAAFLAVYNNIEFGRDYTAEEKFITAAAARYPSSPSVGDLRNEVLAYIKVMKEEFQPGDLLPPITLPDRDGQDFNTGSLKGKYYLIDFWSTWCPQCIAINEAKKQVRKLFPPDRLGMVSVAIDEGRLDWENRIGPGLSAQPGWVQLIDTQMWRGVAVRTLKFDSIPFNFLIDPEGRILRKALPPDSLVAAITQAIDHGRGH